MEIESFLGTPDGGCTFKGGTKLIVTLIGGENAVYGDGYYGFVPVAEAKAERGDLPVGIRAGDHLYGRVEPKI